jgi:hypothetical protein
LGRKRDLFTNGAAVPELPIAEVPRDQADKPLYDQRIRQVTVEKFGVEYGPPEKV